MAPKITRPPLAALLANPDLAIPTFGPRGKEVVALLRMVDSDTPREHLAAIAARWNICGASRHNAHAALVSKVWAGATTGGLRRARLLRVDYYSAAVLSGHGPWLDTVAHTLLTDACLGLMASEWIGTGTQILIRDWRQAFYGA
jgi:hypothetical protein